MKIRTFAALVGVGVITVSPALAAVWDNFPPTESFPNGYDTSVMLTSERNTQVGQGEESATWTIEDASFDGPVFITAIEWIGVTEKLNDFGQAYGYGLADWGIFVGDPEADPNQLNFQQVEGQSGVSYQREVLGEISVTGFETPVFEVFRGRIDLDNVVVNLSTAWFGARLVGDAGNIQGGGTGGRHLVVQGSGHPGSISEGFNADANFFPVWGRASNRSLLPIGPVEFAYRIYYEPVPEPATVGLVLLGGLIAIRRPGR